MAGLAGTGLVIQDNGGDDLGIAKNGPFTFKTAITGAYIVTVKTQPSSPVQTCGVTAGAGTATGNVTNVIVNCAPTFTIGGSIAGLAGTGFTLQNNGGDNLVVSGKGNVNFTFAIPLLSGDAYAVTILTQPKSPAQTCNVFNGSGNVIGNVTNIQISCPQPKFSVSGVVVGLITGPGDTLELQDNAGDNLFVTGDVGFTFPTQFTAGTTYSVNLFLPPTSQPQGCTVFNATAVITSDVSNVIVDCQHNDWAWIFPSSTPTINSYGIASLATWFPGKPIPVPPLPVPNPNTPGGRDFAMAWTDNNGNRWLFGGYGFEVTHPNTNGIPGFLDDMWVWPGGGTGGWQYGGWVPANLPIVFDPTLGIAGGYYADPTPLQFKNSAAPPGARWGGVTWTDAAGNLWMFGGQGLSGLLNDIWEFDITSGPCSYDLTTGTGTFTNCSWIFQGGSPVGNQPTTGAFPGGRWATANCTDTAGNVWMFGGQGYDSGTTVGLMGDLWKYNIASGVWTLVSGGTLADRNGVYGALGVSAGTNLPGGRQNANLWADSAGNIWLFGGFGLDSVGTNLGPGQIGSTLNDLWKYNQGTGQWTWVSGSNLANQNGTYGTATVAAATNVPGSRWGSVSWVDPSDDLWLFGGFGYGSVGSQPTGFLNDVWEFDHTSGQWIWWKGSVDVNQSATYILPYFQLSYVNNVVGARRGAAHWSPDPLGYIYVFGGEGYDSSAGGPYGNLNDIWRYLPFP